MSYIYHKTTIEYNLCNIIIKKQRDIVDELNIILKQQNGYKCNMKSEKIKKHSPASVNIKYETHNKMLIKENNKNRKVSYSLSSKPFIEQINNILSTATRRYDTINILDNDTLFGSLYIKNKYNFPISSPLDLRHNLIKYEGYIEIRNKYPNFFYKDRAFYDVIYTIKTENPHFYIDGYNKTLCDTILICCNAKIFNIMYELDESNPYYNFLFNNYPEHLIKEMYEDQTI